MPPAPFAFLLPHVHLAWRGDDIVVLDVRADEYALLVDAGGLVRQGCRARELVAAPEILEELRALGLVAGEPTGVAAVPVPDLSGEVVAGALPRSGSRLLRAAVDSLVSTAGFAGKPLSVLLETAARRQAPDRAVSDGELEPLVGAFQAVHPWIPFEGDCLQRGFRLHHHLHRAGVPARWVFGVRTWPFLAHCWVQVGERVVGDRQERVQTFTPILAV